jgi:uncharacterized delta-60 repeat protein
MRKCLLLFITFFTFLSAFSQDLRPDPAFGQNGVATTSSVGGFSCAAIQSDGKVVAATSSGTAFVVVRFNPDGSLDNSFGTGGKVTTIFSSENNIPLVIPTAVRANSITLQGDGKIVVAGTADETGQIAGHAFVVARYNPDGTPDNSFDGNGRVITLFTEIWDGIFYYSEAYANAVTVAGNGKIIVVGTAKKEAGYGSNSSSYWGYAVVQYNPNGSVASASVTPVPYAYNYNNLPYSLAGLNYVTTHSSGRVVAGGYANYVGSIVVPINPTGGAITPKIPIASINSLAIQNDGKVVVIGDGADFVLARLNPDGSLDNSFGTGGIVTT